MRERQANPTDFGLTAHLGHVLGRSGRFQEAEGLVCILTSTEQGRTFVSYTPRYAPSGGEWVFAWQCAETSLFTACLLEGLNGALASHGERVTGSQRR